MSNFAHDDMAKMKQRNKTVTILSSGIQLGSVYFVVKTTLEATTERKHQKAEKNCVELHSHRKAPKGQNDAKRAQTPNITINNPKCL